MKNSRWIREFIDSNWFWIKHLQRERDALADRDRRSRGLPAAPTAPLRATLRAKRCNRK